MPRTFPSIKMVLTWGREMWKKPQSVGFTIVSHLVSDRTSNKLIPNENGTNFGVV